MKLPKFLKEFFWDVDFQTINLKEHRTYILKRILDIGDLRSIKWILKRFKLEEIKLIVEKHRISPLSANYWALIFNVDKKNIICLQKPYLKLQKHHWIN